jgi:23S rRNA pseudouridine2605 synthase
MTRRREPTTRDGSSGGERLQKLLASAGIASRRAAEALIVAGRVRVNGKIVQELGTRVDPARDRVHVDGDPVQRPRTRSYLILYKPRGVVSSARDPHAQRTVLDLVPPAAGLFPVGRLDVASEGLLFLTNDGPMAHALLHPSFGVPRTYKVAVDGMVRSQVLRDLATGIPLEGGRTSPCDVKLLSQAEDRSVVEMTLTEGRRHQIREMMEFVGHPVRRLVRTRHGPLELAGLRPGGYRKASERELAALRRMVAESLRAPRRPAAATHREF